MLSFPCAGPSTTKPRDLRYMQLGGRRLWHTLLHTLTRSDAPAIHPHPCPPLTRPVPSAATVHTWRVPCRCTHGRPRTYRGDYPHATIASLAPRARPSRLIGPRQPRVQSRIVHHSLFRIAGRRHEVVMSWLWIQCIRCRNALAHSRGPDNVSPPSRTVSLSGFPASLLNPETGTWSDGFYTRPRGTSTGSQGPGRTVPPPISGRGHCVRHVLWCPFSDQTNSDCSSTIKVRR